MERTAADATRAVHIDRLPKTARELAARIGRPVYIVGGWVRDALLGKDTADIDVASSASPEELEAAFPGAADVINRRLGTVKIRLGDDVYEHTALRSESYAPGGDHAPAEVRLDATVEEDALRRDFSVNALYLDIATGEVLDPTGRGFEDIALRRLRTTTEDPDAILSHDGLRIMRMARLCAEHGFLPDRELMLSARRNSHLLADIAPERIRDELTRLLLADPHRGLTLMRGSGAMDVVFPELMRGATGTDRTEYHKYSVLTHNIMTCVCTPPALHMRLAGLLHDVGKPESMAALGNMHMHDKMGAETAKTILGRLRFDKKTVGRVCFLIRIHMFDLQNNARDKTVRRKVIEWGESMFRDFIALREADVHGSGFIKGPVDTAERHKAILAKMLGEGAPLTAADLAVKGDVIASWGAQGREIGQLQRRLLVKCACTPSLNNKRTLKKLALTELALMRRDQ